MILYIGVGTPLIAIGKFTFRHGLVHLYRVYLRVKNTLKRFFSPAKNKVLYPIVRHGMLHIAVAVIVAVILITNFRATATQAETLGQDTIFGQLLPEDLSGETIETVSTLPQKPVLYMDDFASAGSLRSLGANDGLQVGTAIAQTSGAIVKPTLLTANALSSPRDSVEYYTVQGGDVIGSIAEKFGISVDTILWENRLGANDLIKPGQRLTILPASGVSHQVARGDTVSSIAKKYSVSEDSILEYNHLPDASSIESGDILLVPGGKPPAPPAPAPTPRSTTSSQLASSDPIPPSARVPAGSRLLWPTPGHRINQYFKFRHTGVDIDGDYSSPLWAAADGTVEYVSYQRYGYGYHVIINHGGGMKTLYAHASKIFVQNGQRVSKGQTIAMMGTTGRSTGTHLHFEVIINGRKVNPLSYL